MPAADPGGVRLPVEWEVLDPRFVPAGDPHVERLFDRGRWLEGPAWSPAWGCLLFSDIPNDRVLRWDQRTGRTDVFTEPAGFANGRTIDALGRVVTCEQGPRRVTRTEHDGSTTVLAERWRGQRFNSPNDVVVTSCGSVWFTDPSYGIAGDYEGYRSEPELDGCHVYRVHPDGRLDRVVHDMARPNGLAFTADEDRLLVVDTERRHVRAFDVDDRGDLTDAGVLVEAPSGSFDGLRLDDRGRAWVAASDGVLCVDPDGTPLALLRLPETCANVAFGGTRGNVLFMTATTSLYAIMLDVRGAAPGSRWRP